MRCCGAARQARGAAARCQGSFQVCATIRHHAPEGGSGRPAQRPMEWKRAQSKALNQGQSASGSPRAHRSDTRRALSGVHNDRGTIHVRAAFRSANSGRRTGADSHKCTRANDAAHRDASSDGDSRSHSRTNGHLRPNATPYGNPRTSSQPAVGLRERTLARE